MTWWCRMPSSPPEPGIGPTTNTAASTGSAALRVVEPAPAGAARARHQGRLRRGRVRALLAVDLIAIAVAFAATYGFAELIGPPAVIGPVGVVAAFVAVAIVIWIAVFAAYGLYERHSRAIAPATFDEV